jgi:hypothetical protein
MKIKEISNKHYQEFDVIMLPTDKLSKVGLHSDKKIYLHHSELTKNLPYYQPQHIYILSSEKPKAGDWYITNDNKLLQCREVLFDLTYADGDYGRNKNSIKGKVIASTDSSLGYTDHRVSPVPNFCDSPQIPKEFIEYFIREYNQGNVVNKVLVEVEKTDFKPDTSMGYHEPGAYNYKWKIKSNQNNEVNVLSESKQETLEEAAEKEFPLVDTEWCRTGAAEEENLHLLGHRKSFIKGAKWQAERMYSEDEVGEILYNAFGEYGKYYGIMLDGALINKLFEQFKKK